MSHYEERLEKDIASIRDRVREVAEMVETALRDSIHALLTVDRAQASQTIIGDLRINRAVRALDDRCHAFVARHLPSAGILRFISSVLRLNIALERIGDYAVTICRQAVQLSAAPPTVVARDIEMLADHSRRMLHQSMKAFNETNSELARGTKGMSQQLGRTFDKVLDDLVEEGEQRTRPIRDILALLVTFNRLERVSDQAKNICEETVFVATGEAKAPKVYRVLFVDERNAIFSQMAEAYARKAFPASGQYSSGGWNPAASLDARFLAFMDCHGLVVSQPLPKKMETLHDALADYHVIVDLQGGARERIEELPFHTVLLEWKLSRVADDAVGEPELESAYREISIRVRELMEQLRGEGAC